MKLPNKVKKESRFSLYSFEDKPDLKINMAIYILASIRKIVDFLVVLKDKYENVIIEAVKNSWYQDILNGIAIESFKVRDLDAEVLITPQRKYEKITKERLEAIKEYNKNHKKKIPVNNYTDYSVKAEVGKIISKYPDLAMKLYSVIANYSELTEKEKASIKNDAKTILEETDVTEYGLDIFDNIHKLLDEKTVENVGDLLSTVKPSFQFKSILVDNNKNSIIRSIKTVTNAIKEN